MTKYLEISSDQSLKISPVSRDRLWHLTGSTTWYGSHVTSLPRHWFHQPNIPAAMQCKLWESDWLIRTCSSLMQVCNRRCCWLSNSSGYFTTSNQENTYFGDFTWLEHTRHWEKALKMNEPLTVRTSTLYLQPSCLNRNWSTHSELKPARWIGDSDSKWIW